MSAETVRRICSYKRAIVGSMIVLIAMSAAAVNLSSAAVGPPLSGPPTFNPQGLPLARSHPYLTYDEQAGATLTQDFTSLSFNVSAVAQTGPDGVGPAYLLNGLTKTGYWYQVGLSWKWPSTSGVPLSGFNMNYEVFNQFGFSIYPVTGGGGIDTLLVNAGDLVLLNLNFSGSDVVMQATDWNTTSTATEYYPAYGANYFVGLPSTVSSNGFFTGLMTEEYHSAPYNGTGQPVVYQQNNFNLSSAWVWADEFNTNTNQQVFSDATTSPISVSNATLLNYFSSHGTAEALSGQQFITGLSPIKLPLFKTSTSPTHHMGEQVTLTLNLQSLGSPPIKLRSLVVSAPFGVFDLSSSAPSTPITSNTTFIATIDIPTSAASGNYTLTTVANWRFLDWQLKEWIAADPLQANMTITISGTASPSTPPPSTPPPSTRPPSTPPTTTSPNPVLSLLRNVLLPALLAYTGAAALVVALVIRRERQQTHLPPVVNALICGGCGSPVEQTMLFCSNCGSSLTSPPDHGSASASPQPPPPL